VLDEVIAGAVPDVDSTKSGVETADGAWLDSRDQARRFPLIARKDRARVRLYSRPGNDLTDRFPLIVEALARLRSRSCIIDGEAGCCDEDGMPSFDSIRYRRHGIVSKRKDSIYRSGHSPDWLKMKNPGASGGAAGDRGGLGENAAYPPV
jgi:ATP dependent DNA ligase domain